MPLNGKCVLFNLNVKRKFKGLKFVQKYNCMFKFFEQTKKKKVQTLEVKVKVEKP